MSHAEPSTAGPAAPVAPTAETSPIRAGRLWAFALIGAVLAGVVPFLVFEWRPEQFEPEKGYVTMMGMKTLQPTNRGLFIAERNTAMLAFGVLGGTLGLALGAAGAMARGAGGSPLKAGLVGLLLGGAAGVASTAILVPIYLRHAEGSHEASHEDLIYPMFTSGAVWAAIGGAAGAAMGIGAGAGRRVASPLFGGLLGGMIGMAAYEMIGALVFPTGRTHRPVAATWAPRLIASTLIPVLVAAFATYGLLAPPRKAKVLTNAGPVEEPAPRPDVPEAPTA